jgi:hypothetical protein
LRRRIDNPSNADRASHRIYLDFRLTHYPIAAFFFADLPLGYDGGMTRDEAINTAYRLAQSYDVQLGKCMFEFQHPRTLVWSFLFAMIETRPEWGWFCVFRDDGTPKTLVAMKRPKRFLGL